MITKEIKNSPIQNFFKGKKVFVTGGFGFVGKLLVEKLLKYEVEKIFLMARPKKGKSIEERFEKFLDEPIFSKIGEHERKNYFSRLQIVFGDLTEEINLGISTQDQNQMNNEVEIIYHVAADVRFDENLSDAILANVRGTREILKLAGNISSLKAFIYVSTSFSTANFNVKETFYPPKFDPNMMIKIVENLKDDEKENFEIIARRIIQPFPNTYTFSKSLAEEIVRKNSINLINTKIIRPSIITATYFDPLPGYTDNVYGLNGVLVGAGAGVLRILRIDNKLKSNIVPADYVNNLILAASCYNLEKQSPEKGCEIYNFSSSDENFVTWLDVKRISTAYGRHFPMKKSLWVITYNTTRFKLIAKVLRIFYHFIPSLLFDSILVLMNKKPKLLKLYRKVNKFTEVLEYFTTNSFQFDDENPKALWKIMTSTDKETFPFNIWAIDWENFFSFYVLGLRKYICQEDINTLNDARKKYNRLLVVHYLMLSALIFIFAKVFLWVIQK